jgi:hypothetical protein
MDSWSKIVTAAGIFLLIAGVAVGIGFLFIGVLLGEGVRE